MEEPISEVVAQERRIFRFFEIGILLKGANAVLEIVGGFFALLVPASLVQDVATYFTAEELGQDPNDFIATTILHWANVYATGPHQFFIAAYLLSHGIVKIVLVIGLLKNWPRAYPASLIVFGLFTLYQLYLLTHTLSPGMLALTIFDFAVMYFIWREWQIVKAHQHSAVPVANSRTSP